MTYADDRGSTSAELQAVNRDLSGLLNVAPASLRFGAEVALADEIVVCGILGGKDVGKSTLINALAETTVSVDSAEVGRGTERPMAYVHEATQAVVMDRLRNLDGDAALDVTLHQADAIRNAVLVDLPDFDSEFAAHLETVRRVAPLLDRVLWVLTPRKIGDRAWVEMFTDVIKDPGNVHCVLNKLDELLADADPFGEVGGKDGRGGAERAEAFWQRQERWVAQSIEGAGCPHSPEHRFMVAAAFPEPGRFIKRIELLWDDPAWSRYGNDRQAVNAVARLVCDDLDRLRNCVLGPVSAEQAAGLKEANRKRERETNVARLKRHFAIERTREQLTLACDQDYHQQILNEAMGADYCEVVADGIRTRLRKDTELADDVIERRVQGWPLLRLIHWPFGWLSRVLGRRVSASSAGSQAVEIGDPFETGGRSLLDRIELMRSRVCADHASIIDRLGLDARLPTAAALEKRATGAARRLAPEFERRLLDEVHARDRRPSIIGKAFLWLILLWFPFLQPVGAGLLRMFSGEGPANITLGLYNVVSALSAVHLLAGFAVVAGVFVAILAGMYIRALRAVQRVSHAQDEQDGGSRLVDAVDEVLVTEVAAPLVEPFHGRLERLMALEARLDAMM
jgi:hypothetical protein